MIATTPLGSGLDGHEAPGRAHSFHVVTVQGTEFLRYEIDRFAPESDAVVTVIHARKLAPEDRLPDTWWVSAEFVGESPHGDGDWYVVTGAR